MNKNLMKVIRSQTIDQDYDLKKPLLETEANTDSNKEEVLTFRSHTITKEENVLSRRSLSGHICYPKTKQSKQ